MPEHIVFSCSCGRDLRVKSDLAGTSIRCWSCQAEVPVPRARYQRGRSLWLFVGVRDVFTIEACLAIFLGALIVSFSLAIPIVGAGVALALLAAAAVVYREVIRLSGLQGSPALPGPAWRVWPVRCAWGLVIALGLTAPILMRHVIMDGFGRLIPWRGAGVAAAAALGWGAVPLITLIGSACDRSGPLTVRAAMRAVGRHPIATLAGLLIVPAGLVLVEAAVVSITAQQEWFGYLVLDLFPSIKSDRLPIHYLPPYDVLFPDHAHFTEFFPPYAHGLRLGYSLMGAIPASLARSQDWRVTPWFLLTYDWIYTALRIGMSTLALAGLAFLLAIQARWLGLIPTLDTRRDAATTRPDAE